MAGRMLIKRSSNRDEAGAIAILFAAGVVFLFVLAAIVVDLGLARDTRRESQNAADASALAAVNALYPTSGICTSLNPSGTLTIPCFADAAAAAKSYAATNFGTSNADWTSCTDSAHFYVPASYSQCISFTDGTLTASATSQPTKVRVVVPTREVNTGLGTLADVNTIDVSAAARATLKTSGSLPCGVCVLGTNTHGIGNGDIVANGASVHLNGNLTNNPGGGITVTGGSVTVQGTASGGCCAPAALTGQPHLDDPLAGVLTFPLPGTSSLTVKTNPCGTGGPGKYGAVNLPNATCSLLPGLYVITGAWDFKNNTLLQGTGVTLYFTCGTPAVPSVCNGAGGGMDIKNGDINITAPTTGPLAGLAVAYDPKNSAPLSLQGNGEAHFTGTIYAPASLLSFPGNSCAITFNSAVIVADVYSNGTQACLGVNYSTDQNVKLPPGEPALDK